VAGSFAGENETLDYMNGEDVFGSPYLASEGLLYVIS